VDTFSLHKYLHKTHLLHRRLLLPHSHLHRHPNIRLPAINVFQTLPFDGVADVYRNGRAAEVFAAADEVPAEADGGEAREDDRGVVHCFGGDGEAVGADG
jgi:hypothetical protein